MGFEFGVLQKLDYRITLYCFVLVVAFVILVEYVLGILEYFLEQSKLYTKMVKMLYKELMLMGMLTFCVMMYEAVPRNEEDIVEEEWLAAIDFSHVYLFFVTFFFVLHAFYLMMMSVSAVSEYRLMFSEKTTDVIEGLQAAKRSALGSLLFYMKLLPWSRPRYHAEFSLVQSLFMRLYRLPEELDFPYYLSGCFDRFALAIINRSVFTWVVLLFLVVCNYLRIKYDLTEGMFEVFFDTLGLTVTEQTPLAQKHVNVHDSLYLFMICAIVLTLYTIALTIITRLYKARLVDRVYPDHNSIEDYVALLRAKQHEQAQLNPAVKALRITPEALKKEIELEFDAQEEGEEEDAEGIKFLAEFLLSTYKYLDETATELMVYLRVRFRELCCYPTPPLSLRTGGMLASGEPGGAAPVGKRVSEARAVHVPLKRRLKFTHEEKMIIAGRTRSTERDGLTSGSGRASYGTAGDDHMPIYGEVSTMDMDGRGGDGEGEGEGQGEGEGRKRRRRRRRPQPVERDPHPMQTFCSALCCCSCCVSEWEDANLNSIFMAGKPIWFFRAVELQIMFTCMYMALWATNFVTLVRGHHSYSPAQEYTIQAIMVLPILFAFNRTAYIAETYSLITAICDLNLEVLHEVLVNTEDMAAVADELRGKIHEKIRAWARTSEPSVEEQRMFVHLLFEEVDADGSGEIDRQEFRMLLRKLNLNYSDHRFNLLFRAVDSIGGDGMVEEDDLLEFMFPLHDQDGDDEEQQQPQPSRPQPQPEPRTHAPASRTAPPSGGAAGQGASAAAASPALAAPARVVASVPAAAPAAPARQQAATVSGPSTASARPSSSSTTTPPPRGTGEPAAPSTSGVRAPTRGHHFSLGVSHVGTNSPVKR